MFALTNLPETVKGALFARYSRYQGTLRRLLPRRVRRRRPVGDAPVRRRRGRTGRPALRAHLHRLRRRLGRPARRRPPRLRVGQQRPHQGPAARPPRRLPRAVDPLHPLRHPDRSRRCAGLAGELALLARRGARPRVRRRDGRDLLDLLGDAQTRARLGRAALAARRGAAERLGALDQGEGPRPAPRPAPRRDPLPRRHLRVRAGLRAAPPPARLLAAARGPRGRRDGARGARRGDPELHLAGRPARTGRRVDLLSRAAPHRHRTLGRPARARSPRRLRRAVGRADPRRRRRGSAARRLPLRGDRAAGERDRRPDRHARPDRARGHPRRPGRRARQPPPPARARLGGGPLPLRGRLRLRRLPRPAAPPHAHLPVAVARPRSRRRGPRRGPRGGRRRRVRAGRSRSRGPSSSGSRPRACPRPPPTRSASATGSATSST